MDMATFAMGCMSYENQRNQGNLPQHDQEFQAETGIGPVYNMGRPQTRQEQREALEEDGRMTPRRNRRVVRFFRNVMIILQIYNILLDIIIYYQYTI